MSGSARGWANGLAGILALSFVACARPAPPPLPAPVPDHDVDPATVESVLFLLGDPGEARDDISPLMVRLGEEIESWSGRLAPDAAVGLIVLGDLVYPEGLRPPGSAAFHADTAVLMSQARLVAGPRALQRGATAYLLAGNHDWGYGRGRATLEPLHRLERVLRDGRTSTGADVRLVPEVGTGGPHVVDWGAHLRLVMLETQWWLVASSPPERREVLARIEEVVATSGGREIVIAAHHPFRSGGPHGGRRSFWRTLGVQFLLFRSGAILQDLTSAPYRELENGLRSIFRRHGVPLVFAGGHEHSLQVIRAVEETDPRYSIVSGSGSKLSPVGDTPGTLFAAAAPGYARLFVLRDGSVLIDLAATEPAYRLCATDVEERVSCMAEGISAFRTVFARRIR